MKQQEVSRKLGGLWQGGAKGEVAERCFRGWSEPDHKGSCELN